MGFQLQLLKWMPGIIWGWFLHLGCIYVPVVFFHFAFYFSDKRQGFIFVKIAYLIATIFILLNTFTTSFTQETIYRDFFAYPKPALLYPLYILFFQIVGFGSTLLLIQKGRGLPSNAWGIFYLFLIVYLLAYLGSMDNFLIMYDIRIFPLYPYGLYMIPPFVIFGSYAVSKLLSIDQTSRV